jgi:hemerythrin superfamily protein
MENQRLITAYFEADHDRLDSLFRHFQLHKRSDMEKAKSYFKVFLQGLKRHIVWEEGLCLYTAVNCRSR